MKVESLKETWIYWKWLNDDVKTYSKSYVQNIVKTTEGVLLELTDSLIYSNYPNRVLAKDITILELIKQL